MPSLLVNEVRRNQEWLIFLQIDHNQIITMLIMELKGDCKHENKNKYKIIAFVLNVLWQSLFSKASWGSKKMACLQKLLFQKNQVVLVLMIVPKEYLSLFCLVSLRKK